jgi:hypothetical protein
VPIDVPLSRNVTEPAGVPVNEVVTVAVNVTDWSPIEGFNDEASDVVVGARLTTWVSTLDVLAANVELPPYCAVIGCDATASEDVVRVATPLPLSVPEPIDAPLSRNVTVPAGVPVDVVVTVAVNRIDWPLTEGFTDEASAVVVGARLTT